jgi:hypothetical protein
MTQGNDAHSASGDVLAMASLASRQDLPPRVRELLQGVLGLVWRNLERSLATTLDEFERTLIQQANKPKVGQVGERCLDSVRRIKPTRADLVPRFMLSLEDDMSRFDRRTAAAPATKKVELTLDGAWQDLSLVGSNELDESLTLREMASKVEARHSVPLYELGYRFGVLAGRAPFDVESLPLGPGRVTAALRYAVAGLDLPQDHRILFYQTFERLTMSGLGALYVGANTYFAEQRILRHLQLQTMTKPRATDARVGAPVREPASAPPPRPRPGSDVDVAGFGLAAFEVASSGPARRETAAPTPRETRLLRAPSDGRDGAQFAALRERLSERREALGVLPTPRTADAFEPGARELQQALAVLQVRSPPTIMLGGKVVQRTITQLRQDLLNQLRHATPPGQTPRIADEDSDTIDLVGALFEQLMQATRPNGRTQTLLTRLQVPILRAALRDKRFFANRDHAARNLLNAIADSGTHWLDDSAAEADPLLAERLQRAVDRINAEYDTDMRVFDQVAEELVAYVQSLARKAEVAERRLVEACRGREKLALARDGASRAITIRLAAAKPSRLLRTLLEQAWTDVLALTLLRQGEKSDAYKRQLAVADQLIAVGGRMHAIAADPIAATWREEIESGLLQVGYHADEVQAVIQRLFAPEQIVDDDSAMSQTDLAIRLKSKMRLGETGADDAPPALPRAANLPLTPAESQMLERLKALPFGTWFDIGGPAQGDGGRIKLSWSSPLTSRCLLTNQRGARVDERGLEQLARDLVAGRVRFAREERDALVERCWNAVLGTLEKGAAARDPGALSA